MKTLVFIVLCASVVGAAISRTSGIPDNPPPVWDTTRFDGNRIRCLIGNYGDIIPALPQGECSLVWPAGSGSARAFNGRIMIAGKMNGELVGAANYWSDYDFQPGVIDPQTGQPEDPADPRYKIYKINRGDSLSSDYLNWPVQDGAPVDAGGRPLFLGDQVLWCVYNEGDTFSHPEMEPRQPMGLEVQQTVYGFLRKGSHLDNSMFIRLLVINKGSYVLDTLLLGTFFDPDNCIPDKNRMGIDTTSGYAFVYASRFIQEAPGVPAAAVGFQWLGCRMFSDSLGEPLSIPLYSFTRPVLPGFPPYPKPGGDYLSPFWIFPILKGMNTWNTPYFEGGLGGNPYNPVTRFWFTGNPLDGSGWVDTYTGEKNFLWSAAPVRLCPGDSLELNLAIFLARAGNPLGSLELLGQVAGEIRNLYTENFRQLPPGLEVRLQRKSDTETTVILNSHSPEATAVEVLLRSQSAGSLPPIPLYDDGAHGDSLAGDGIWSNTPVLQLGAEAYIADVLVNYADGSQRLWPAQAAGIQALHAGDRYRVRMAQVFSEGDIYQYQVRKQDVFSEPLVFTLHPVYPNPLTAGRR